MPARGFAAKNDVRYVHGKCTVADGSAEASSSWCCLNSASFENGTFVPGPIETSDFAIRQAISFSR